MTIDGIEFVRKHGVVLESAKGPVANLAEAVAGSPIRGNWWAHPKGNEIFRATRRVRDSERVLVCRVIEGKVTYVDRRLWPALARLARHFKRADLAAIREEHSSSGAHQLKMVPFPKWLPPGAGKSAKTMSEAEAARQLGPWVGRLLSRPGK